MVSIAKSASVGSTTHIGVCGVGVAEVWVVEVEIRTGVRVKSKKEKFSIGDLGGGGGGCQDLVGVLGVDALVS